MSSPRQFTHTCETIKVNGKDVIHVSGDPSFESCIPDTGTRHHITKIIETSMKDK